MTAFNVQEFIENYALRNGTTSGVTQELTKEARKRGSTDNITIVLVTFP